MNALDDVSLTESPRSPRARAPHLLRRALCAAGLCALAGCQPPQRATATPPLVVAQPVRPLAAAEAEGTLRYPIEAATRFSNAVSFRVPGKLIERSVRLGDTVRAGQVLARLDPSDARAQLASAQAALQAAEHRVQFATAQLERDRAQSAQDLIAANQLEASEDALAAAQAGREQAAAQLALARDALQYQSLLADHDGRISSENADTGQVLAAGQPVYVVAWSGALDVDMDAAASDLSRLATGQAASVRFTVLPGRRYAARVREIDPVADPQSRSYRVKLTLLQPDDSLAPGMTGEATLEPLVHGTGARSGRAAGPGFRVPAAALFHRGAQPAVWVIRPQDSTLELRPVTVIRYEQRAVLVGDGLRDGERIVVAGVHTVYAGERVQPVAPLFDDAPAEGALSDGDTPR